MNLLTSPPVALVLALMLAGCSMSGPARAATERPDAAYWSVADALQQTLEGDWDAGPGWVGNLGPGLRFHYNPRTPLDDPHNVDSAEYANLVWTFAPAYLQARRAGMPPLSLHDRTLLRAWATRMLAGYWTHGGYLNWDTGFGFRRWHELKKLALAQAGLLSLAATAELQRDTSSAAGRSGCSTEAWR